MTVKKMRDLLRPLPDNAIIAAGFVGISGHANSFDGTVYDGKNDNGKPVVVLSLDEDTVSDEEMTLTEREG